jgi:hypothetical protein
VRNLELSASDLGFSSVWDGKDEQGKEVVSGIYFYKFQSDDNEIIGKMLKIE